MNFRISRARGLTLVELMVVLVVLVILASVAYPLYTEQAQRSRRADAKSGLELIALAQERYYTVNGTYAVTMGSLSINGATLTTTSDRGYYTLALSGGGQNFSATATPVGTNIQAGDSGCTQFSINQLGVHGSTGSSSNCW